MKLLPEILSQASHTPHMKFTWVAAGLLGILMASIAMRQLPAQRAFAPLRRIPFRKRNSIAEEFTPRNESDQRLKADVTAAIDRELSIPGSLLVGASEGAITLQGQILATDLKDVIKAAHSVPGVKKLITRLETHDIMDVAPELQKPRQVNRPSEIPTDPETLDRLEST